MANNQQQLNWGVCDHKRTEKVITYGGKTIAFRCSGCAKITCHYGVCAGCKKGPQKLQVFNGRDKKDYCDETCKTRSKTRERKEKKAVL